ncbi:hypothetical protein lbkm_4118 [Lachnospiraceae bacterium KM106-2]|nr:hypothetical protein lbkm_4118 [Lachnospiraceae bacterium KM106-2]
MSYKRAEQVLPVEVIELIQNFVDGECIYIPRKENMRKEWGHSTKIREQLQERNHQIYEDYLNGLRTVELARKYYLSEKSIQRIIRERKRAA